MLRSNARVIVLAVCSALALTGSAEAAGLAVATVSIKGQNGDYSGTVYSPKLHKCADQRSRSGGVRLRHAKTDRWFGLPRQTRACVSSTFRQ